MSEDSGKVYCVECLVDIGVVAVDHDGMCDTCREHIADGGTPRDHGGDDKKFDILDSVDDIVDVLLDEHRREERNGVLFGEIQEAIEGEVITVREIIKRFDSRLHAKLGIKKPNPVRLPNGKVECFLIKEFACPVCGCNVYHKPDDTNLDLFQCNSCESKFQARDEE
jgi:hypothetical protein